MSTLTAPARTRQTYRHEAFFWRDRRDFVGALAPFVLEGLAAGEPVVAALVPEHTAWLRNSLGSSARGVWFVDITEVGRNPARILPAWQEFVQDRSGEGQPARGVGEPIWPGRSQDEVLECQLHEALLNLAVPPDVPFWLLCPYDERHLQPEVIAEAYRSHPVVTGPGCYRGSPSYAGRAHAHAIFTAELPEPPGRPVELAAHAGELAEVFPRVTLHAAQANLSSDKIINLAGAVRGLALSSLHRGATSVRVRLWDLPDAVVCEVADDSRIEDYLVGRRSPRARSEECLWQANATCDLVQVRSNEAGTRIRLHQHK